jgi:hypothetical protein
MFVPYRLRDFWYEAQNKSKKYAKKSALPGWCDDLEGFQAAIHPREYIGGIYLARVIQAFNTIVTVQCGNQSQKIHGSVTTHTSSSVSLVSHVKRMVRVILITSIFN